ncbi:MAG: hypothetical protein KA449_01720 [Pelolinea sp.]|nr:hypothetical protein [Pelolinea sp.]
MRLTRPKNTTFWIATVLAALGIIGHFTALPFVSQYDFLLVAAGFIILWLGVAIKGF